MRRNMAFLNLAVAALFGAFSAEAAQRAKTHPAPPPSENPALPESLIANARQTCVPKQSCPQLMSLLPLAQSPQYGAEVLTLFAEQRDPRTANCCAQVAAYGQSDALRAAGRVCLQSLAGDPAAQPAVVTIARNDADATLRDLASAALEQSGMKPASPALAPVAAALAAPVVSGAPTTVAATTAAAPPHTAVVSAPKRSRAEETARTSDPTRVIYTQTGFSHPAHSGAWGAYDLAYHRVDYGVTDSLQIGAGTLVPIGVYLLAPQVKYTLHPSEKVHIGLITTVGVLGHYIDDGGAAVFYGGGAALTLGTPELFLNTSVTGGGATAFAGWEGDAADYDQNDDTVWALMPSLGGSWRASSLVRLNVELTAVLGDHDKNGEIWLLLYGVRLAGDHLFGDVSFVYPFFPGMWDTMKYIPIGFPLLTFGYHW